MPQRDTIDMRNNAILAQGWVRGLFLLLVLLCSYSALYGANVVLVWDANTESDLAGYKVYYGTSSGTYGSAIDVGKVTTYTVANLGPGTYFFAVTAHNTAGLESGYSNEVSTTVSGTCSYTVSPTLQTFGKGSGSGAVSVTATTGCAWTATSSAAWVTITGGASGNGNGTVSYAVAANSTGNPRTGTMTVAGQTVTISQQGTACDMNRDGAANSVDIQLLVNVILGIATCPGTCELNNDGKVDSLDLQLLLNVVLGVRTCP